jgi:uncharacterized GH25 family protein
MTQQKGSTMRSSLKWVALALVLGLPLGAQAHRAWLLPSTTILSGNEDWVTVDAAVSNDLFYFEHMPMRIQGFPAIRIARGGGPQATAQQAAAPQQGGEAAAGGPMGGPTAELVIVAPDGAVVEAQNRWTGRFRSTFDFQVTQKGTYRVAAITDALFATWKENGQTRRWRGTPEALAREVPERAEELSVIRAQGRIETFVTAGRPGGAALKPTGKGLELVPVTHPNDLFAGETAIFRLQLDGKPAAEIKVAVIQGGIRYRQQLKETTVTTGANGEFAVTWGQPGMYWINAAITEEGPAGTREPRRRASYAATLEVMPQ